MTEHDHTPASTSTPDPDAVCAFWFEAHGPGDWFSGSADFDAEVRARFGALHTVAARGELHGWRRDARGRLAEIIVLDQFSRQLYRKRPEAFACDMQALTLSQEFVAGGHAPSLSSDERIFAYMPHMHAESLLVQEAALALFAEFGAQTLTFAQEHHDIIARFGRFPYRNVALGRTSTPEELAYLQDGAHRFGQ